MAQVDWGSFGQLRIGATTRPLSCFAMVLSWSRAIFVDFALDMRLDTFLRMHERAFVLLPILCLCPQLVHPVLRLPLRALCENVSTAGTILRLTHWLE